LVIERSRNAKIKFTFKNPEPMVRDFLFTFSAMNAEEIRQKALQLKAVTEDLKWGEHLCFCVHEKIFLVLSLDETPVCASFKVTEEQFDELCEHDGIAQAPYFAKRQWVKVNDVALLTSEKWNHYINNSYHLVAAKLPKKLRLELF
jgi:predicted DNA-binding protein (MmcQ/YjbR family)